MPKISQLPVATQVNNADLFAIVQAGVTKQATQSLVIANIQSGIQITESQVTGLTTDLAARMLKSANLSDVADVPTSRNNLGLGSAALLNSPIPVVNGGTGLTATVANQLLYSSTTSVIAGLATANSSVLVTDAGGVPSLNSVLPGGLTTTDPTVAQGIATKNYVDQTALNGTSAYAASAGSLGTVTQSGAGVGATLTNAGVQAIFALDGVNPPVGTNVLIKNTATGMTSANEGVYIVTNPGSIITNWVLTRATDYDTPIEINNTGLIAIQNGSTLAGTAWYNSATIVTVDTTAFVYTQFGNTGTVTSVTFTGDGTVLSSTPSSAVTTSGTLTATLNTQAKNTILAGPASGSNASPTFRALVAADFPLSGTFTPAFTPTTGTFTTVTYGTQVGKFIQMGNMIFFSIDLELSAFSVGSASGNLKITGLPVAQGGASTDQAAINVQNITSTTVITNANITGSQIFLFGNVSAAGPTIVQADGLSATAVVRITGQYFTS